MLLGGEVVKEMWEFLRGTKLGYGTHIQWDNLESAVEEIIWNFDDVQKAYATRGYEAKNRQ
jgi:hypothetical protein